MPSLQEGISRLDKSSELLTFHEAVKELEDAEDELVEKHTIILHVCTCRCTSTCRFCGVLCAVVS